MEVKNEAARIATGQCPGIPIDAGKPLFTLKKAKATDPEQPGPQLEVFPLAKYTTPLDYKAGKIISVSSRMTAYALKNGSIRIMGRSSSAVALVKGHEEPPCDMAMIDREEEGASLLVSTSPGGLLMVTRLEWPRNSAGEIAVETLLSLKHPLAGGNGMFFSRVRWEPCGNQMGGRGQRFVALCRNEATIFDLSTFSVESMAGAATPESRTRCRWCSSVQVA